LRNRNSKDDKAILNEDANWKESRKSKKIFIPPRVLKGSDRKNRWNPTTPMRANRVSWSLTFLGSSFCLLFMAENTI
jgi:hypothetical protein